MSGRMQVDLELLASAGKGIGVIPAKSGLDGLVPVRVSGTGAAELEQSVALLGRGCITTTDGICADVRALGDALVKVGEYIGRQDQSIARNLEMG